MPQYDLNGNPLPEDPASTPAATSPQQPVQYDLAGNPMPAGPYGAPPAQPPPAPPQPGQPSSGGYGLPPQPPYQPGYTAQQQAARKPGTYFDGKQYRFTNEQQEPAGKTAANLAIASVVALVVAILGSIGIMKVALYIGMGFSLLYLALGFGVGFILSFATRNKGAAIGLAMLMLTIGLFVGHYTFAQDAAAKYPEVFGGASGLAALGTAMSTFKGVHWLFVLLSYAACLRGAASNVGNDLSA